jgi:hypothetical protein
LREDADRIANVQRATSTTRDFGIEPTHGLFGSPEWWSNIDSGVLPTRTVRGVITRVYMASMNDWPEFELRSDSGELSRWTREANTKQQAALYEANRRVELDYVVQHLRRASLSGCDETQVVLEIRVEEAC